MIQVGSKVKDKISSRMATVLESTTVADGYSSSTQFLIQTSDGDRRWRKYDELSECLTNDGGLSWVVPDMHQEVQS